MRKLIAIAVLAACVAAAAVGGAFLLSRSASLTLAGAVALPVGDRPGTVRVFLGIENAGAPDRLLSASSGEAASASFAGRAVRDSYPIPAGGKPSLSSDGVYIELTGIDGDLSGGRLIPVSLEFETAGTATTRARIDDGTDPHAGHMADSGEAVEEKLSKEELEEQVAASMAGLEPPTVELDISAGAEGAWDVAVRTGNFTFDPDTEDMAHAAGHGHAHLYLEGIKVGRMYSRTAEIGALPPGRYTVTVTLNSNTHVAYRDRDGPVAAEAAITAE